MNEFWMEYIAGLYATGLCGPGGPQDSQTGVRRYRLIRGLAGLYGVLTEVRFINGKRASVAVSQGLKPLLFPTLFGTTEVVPCYSPRRAEL
jgi:hypothetical protein